MAFLFLLDLSFFDLVECMATSLGMPSAADIVSTIAVAFIFLPDLSFFGFEDFDGGEEVGSDETCFEEAMTTVSMEYMK